MYLHPIIYIHLYVYQYSLKIQNTSEKGDVDVEQLIMHLKRKAAQHYDDQRLR